MGYVKSLELEYYLDEPQDELSTMLDKIIEKGTYTK